MEEERKPQSKLQAGNCIFGLKRETNRILFHNPLENTKNGKHFWNNTANNFIRIVESDLITINGN